MSKKNKIKKSKNKKNNKDNDFYNVNELWDELQANDDAKLPPEFYFKVANKVIKKDSLISYEKNVWRYRKNKGYYEKLSDIALENRISKRLTYHENVLAKKGAYSEIKARIYRDAQNDGISFNDHPNYINCQNCIVRVKKNALVPYKHSQKYHFSYRINAKCLKKTSLKDAPNFAKFCQTSLGGNKKKMRLLLQVIGYMCSDMTGAKKAFFFYGEPDSGKSIMTDFIKKLIGPDVVSNIPIHELGDKFSKANLYGMKANIYSEMKNAKLPDISTFKSVTSGDTISGEYKKQDRFSFDPKAKLLYAGNSFPFSQESDHTAAFLNRICVLVFGKSVPVEKQDIHLRDKLWKERHVIFTLALEELRKLKKNNFQFTVPKDSKNFLQHYEKMQNSVDSFVDEFCELGEGKYLAITNFRNLYKAFCQENAYEVVKDEELVARLHGKYNVTRKDKLHRGSYNRASFLGITWKPEFEFLNNPNIGTKAGIPSFQALFDGTEPEQNGAK